MSWGVAVLAVPAVCTATGSGGTALGCNPSAPGNRQQLFADWVKTSLFGQPDIPGSQNTTTDAKGWPTQDFSLSYYNEPGGYYYPAVDFSGTYTVTALGCATVSIPEGIGGVSVVNQSCPKGNLLAFVEISSDGDAIHGHGALAFTNTTRGPGLGSGLTNVSMLLPGYPAGTDPDTLHEPALANIRGRCTLARFIGWAMFGHSAWDTPTPPTPCDWSIRPRVGDPTYVLGGWGIKGLGVPYEIIAKVANALEVDAWILIPSSTNESARDEYVMEVVKLFDQLLPRHRKLYLEYANECFFGNNQCYDDDQTLANVTVLEKGDPYRLNYGLSTPPNATANLNTWNARMYAFNARRLAQLAAAVVGKERVGRADGSNVRVVPVIGALGNYAEDGWHKLEWLHAAWGPPVADGLATMNIGAYFGPSRNVTSNPNVTSDEAIQSMLATVDAARTSVSTAYGSNPLAGFAAASSYHGLALHAYEGGPSTAGGSGNAALELGKACADPRMADVVADIIAVWQSWTGGTFNYFQLGAQPLEQPWGSFSNLWDIRVPDTPKTRGIDRVVAAPPAPLSAGWPAPLVRHNASFYVGYYTKDKTPPVNPQVTWLPQGTMMHYLVRFSSSTACASGVNVTVTMSSTVPAGGEPLEVSIGSFLPAVNISSPATNGSKTDLKTATALFAKLPSSAPASGLITVRLRVPVEGVHYELWYLDTRCR